MRRLLGNIVSVIHSFIRLCFLKLFHFRSLKFHLVERISPNVIVEMNKNASLVLGRGVRIHSGCKLKARNGSCISIGEGVKINYNCIIVSRESINIDTGVEFGPGVFVYDHDHDYRGGIKESGFQTAPISIGENSWIGANSIILRGTNIGKNCVVAAGSVVKGNVPDNSLFLQKRESSVKRVLDGCWGSSKINEEKK